MPAALPLVQLPKTFLSFQPIFGKLHHHPNNNKDVFLKYLSFGALSHNDC